MKRKNVIAIGLMVMALLTGCGQGREPLVTGDTQEEIPKESNVKKENKEYSVQTVNLTAQNQTAICLDYMIEGYEDAQRFGYGIFEKNMQEENPVLSPVSAYLALSLAGAGAEGETLEEFQEVLGDLQCIPHDLMNHLPRETEGMKIMLANSAWVDERMLPDEEWLAWADSVYQSEVFQTKLSTTTAMEDMNQWIDTNTNGLIPILLTEPLSEDSRLALFNTIYFKGDWKNKFKENHTREMDFTLADGSVKQVQMMNQYEEHLQYVKNDMAEGVILPYKDESMAFVALKPVGETDVRQMYEGLTLEDLSSFLKQQETTLCNLRLPKFEVEFTRTLNDSLKEMGLQLAFVDGGANFRGLGTTDAGAGLFIDTVLQKAVVIVDESGTEAAAVTMVDMQCESAPMPEPVVEIYFDEPFLYMIMDMEREVPLFIGIMDNPGTM